jgi:hypothetical protein
MPIAAAIPAIIGAAGSIGGGLLAKKSGGSSDSGLEQQLLQMMKGDASSRDAINNETAGPLSYFFNSDPTKSGLYKDYLTQGTQSTAEAYDNAKSNLLSANQKAGFGYTQPTVQGGQEALSNEEAKAQAAVPGQALTQTIQPELEALNIRSGEAKDYNPASYVNGVTDLQENQDKQNSALYSSLFNLAGQTLGPNSSIWKKKVPASSPIGAGGTSYGGGIGSDSTVYPGF